jgi:nucleotide-binding universal stress UspA family protein
VHLQATDLDLTINAQVDARESKLERPQHETHRAGAGDDLIRPWPRKILLACDGSRHAASAANIVAAMASPGSTVRVITVQSYEFASYTGEWGPLSDEPQRQERLKSIINQVFDEPLELLGQTDCEIQRTTRLGNPAEQILAEVDEWKPNLVVVGRAGLGGMSRFCWAAYPPSW